MLYLAIDLHKKQITVNLRNEEGSVLLKKQISTNHTKIDEFFKSLAETSAPVGGFMAIYETCGFGQWLHEKLREFGCKHILVVQPDTSTVQKTDRRDANHLGEILWNNRQRIVQNLSVNGIRQIVLPTQQMDDIRKLTKYRRSLSRERGKVIVKIKDILRKYNMEQDCPTKMFTTKKCQKWLKELELPVADRVIMNSLLAQWHFFDQEILPISAEIIQRSENNEDIRLLTDIPGVALLGAAILVAHIGDITRFRTPDSLANYCGLAPNCHNSGETTSRNSGMTKREAL
ncbi:MAG: IS110 family transposase [Fibrobacter sp.]|nr:IS110 family transposase [Fibrobacter sp.]